MEQTLTSTTTLDNVKGNILTPAPLSNNIIVPQNQPGSKEYKSFYKTIKGGHANMCAYPTRLDTYGCGCSHDCDYCYARHMLKFRNLWFPEDPRIADIVKIEKVIRKIAPGTTIRLGGMVDCFMPLELKKMVTLETIKLLNHYRIGYLIVTKSPIVAYPPFMDVMDRDLAHIQITVTSLNPAVSKQYEKTWPPDQRIRAILTLQENGFDTAIRESPLIEEYMDFDLLNNLGIDNCIIEFLRINGWIKKALPLRDYTKYTWFSGNYRHQELEEKLRIISKVKIKNISVCEKVPEHYDYWQNNYNPNPKDCCNLRISPQQTLTKTDEAKPKPKICTPGACDTCNRCPEQQVS